MTKYRAIRDDINQLICLTRRSCAPQVPGFLSFMGTPPTTKIGSTVQRLRLAAGLTQQHVAELAEIAPETLSRIERNRIAPSLDVVGKLATALRVRPADLFATEPKARKATLRPAEREWMALVRDLDDADVQDMVRAVRLMLRVRRSGRRRSSG